MQKIWQSKKESGSVYGFRSEISVFLALITILVFSLILSSVELLRTQAARTYLQAAANSAVDSLFSQYHLELWEDYRLLGTEMYSGEEILTEYNGFLEPYLSREDAWNWYGLSQETDGVSLNEYALMTDENGAVFEQEVCDYMLYGWTMDAAGLAEVQKETETLESAESTGETAEELEKCSGKALALQKKLNALSASVKEHNTLKKELGNEIARGNGTRIHALLMKLERCLDGIKTDVENVRQSAGKLETEVNAAETGLEARHSTGKLTEENYRQLSGQLDNYRAYTDDSSAQVRELEELESAAVSDAELLEQVEISAEEAKEYIENWVPEQILVRYDPPKKDGEQPVPVYEDEVLDEAAVWAETAELFGQYEELSFAMGTGTVDGERAAALDSIESLLTGSLLLLVFPEAEKLSKEERNLTEAPSVLYPGEDTNVFNDEDYLLNKIAVSEYAMVQLSNLKAGTEKKEKSKSSTGSSGGSSSDSSGTGSGNSSESSSGSSDGEGNSAICKPELEYVLHGCKSDYQNVAKVAAELIGIRTGLNLTYLLSSKEAMAQAAELAVAVTGAAAGTPLVYVVTFLVLSVWASGQAVLDVRELFSDGKVPFMHTKKTFRLSLDTLLTDFGTELTKKKTSENGMDYRDWLRILLYTRSGSRTDYRIMDVIQENLRKEQADFCMDRLYTAMDFSVREKAKHVFITPGTYAGQEYSLTVNTYYAYSE